MIQVRLWKDCYNNCSFCSLKDETKYITNIADKKERINKLLELNDDTIGIIGGEFFEGQLRGVEKEWLNMIKKIKCQNLFITANLIHEQYLLKETLAMRDNILICTSYDTIGRFKSDEEKEIWLSRVNKLNNIFCTIVPTQDMIIDNFIERIQCGINLCEPHLGIEWYNKVNKQNYHDILIKENHAFNLPKRRDFIHWIIKHNRTLTLMKNYKANHFTNILGFNSNNDFIIESNNRFKDKNYMANCGHPYFSRCYADSDRCLMCDIEEL